MKEKFLSRLCLVKDRVEAEPGDLLLETSDFLSQRAARNAR